MKSKVVPFLSIHFDKIKERPLTERMIYTLLVALQKQERNIPFGQHDLKGGSFAVLVERGLIVSKRVVYMGHRESQWQVTKVAQKKLQKLGIEI